MESRIFKGHNTDDSDSESESEADEDFSTDDLCEDGENNGGTFSSVQCFVKQHPGCLVYIELHEFLLVTSTIMRKRNL